MKLSHLSSPTGQYSQRSLYSQQQLQTSHHNYPSATAVASSATAHSRNVLSPQHLNAPKPYRTECSPQHQGPNKANNSFSLLSSPKSQKQQMISLSSKQGNNSIESITSQTSSIHGQHNQSMNQKPRSSKENINFTQQFTNSLNSSNNNNNNNNIKGNTSTLSSNSSRGNTTPNQHNNNNSSLNRIIDYSRVLQPSSSRNLNNNTQYMNSTHTTPKQSLKENSNTFAKSNATTSYYPPPPPSSSCNSNNLQFSSSSSEYLASASAASTQQQTQLGAFSSVTNTQSQRNTSIDPSQPHHQYHSAAVLGKTIYLSSSGNGSTTSGIGQSTSTNTTNSALNSSNNVVVSQQSPFGSYSILLSNGQQTLTGIGSHQQSSSQSQDIFGNILVHVPSAGFNSLQETPTLKGCFKDIDSETDLSSNNSHLVSAQNACLQKALVDLGLSADRLPQEKQEVHACLSILLDRIESITNESVSCMSSVARRRRDVSACLEGERNKLNGVFAQWQQILEVARVRALAEIEDAMQAQLLHLEASEAVMRSQAEDAVKIRSDIEENLSNIFTNLELKPFQVIFKKYSDKLDSFSVNVNRANSTQVRILSVSAAELRRLTNVVEEHFLKPAVNSIFVGTPTTSVASNNSSVYGIIDAGLTATQLSSIIPINSTAMTLQHSSCLAMQENYLPVSLSSPITTIAPPQSGNINQSGATSSSTAAAGIRSNSAAHSDEGENGMKRSGIKFKSSSSNDFVIYNPSFGCQEIPAQQQQHLQQISNKDSFLNVPVPATNQDERKEGSTTNSNNQRDSENAIRKTERGNSLVYVSFNNKNIFENPPTNQLNNSKVGSSNSFLVNSSVPSSKINLGVNSTSVASTAHVAAIATGNSHNIEMNGDKLRMKEKITEAITTPGNEMSKKSDILVEETKKLLESGSAVVATTTVGSGSGRGEVTSEIPYVGGVVVKGKLSESVIDRQHVPCSPLKSSQLLQSQSIFLSNGGNKMTQTAGGSCRSPNSVKYLELIDKINTNQLNTNIFYSTLMKENAAAAAQQQSQQLSVSSSTQQQLQLLGTPGSATVPATFSLHLSSKIPGGKQSILNSRSSSESQRVAAATTAAEMLLTSNAHNHNSKQGSSTYIASNNSNVAAGLTSPKESNKKSSVHTTSYLNSLRQTPQSSVNVASNSAGVTPTGSISMNSRFSNHHQKKLF